MASEYQCVSPVPEYIRPGSMDPHPVSNMGMSIAQHAQLTFMAALIANPASLPHSYDELAEMARRAAQAYCRNSP